MNAPKLQAGSIVAAPGEAISIPVFLLEDCAINAISLCISCIDVKDEFLRVEPGKLMPGEPFANAYPTPGKPARFTVMFAWTSPTSLDYHLEKGTVICHIILTHKGGNSKIKFENDPLNTFNNTEIASGLPSVAMNDEPTEEYFKPGYITDKNSGNSGW